MMEKFQILFKVVATHMYTFIKSNQIVHLRPLHFMIYKFYFNILSDNREKGISVPANLCNLPSRFEKVPSIIPSKIKLK